MSADFEETEKLFPRPAFLALAGILIATEAFIIVCACFGLGIKTWAIAVTGIVFAAVIAVAWWLRSPSGWPTGTSRSGCSGS